MGKDENSVSVLSFWCSRNGGKKRRERKTENTYIVL